MIVKKPASIAGSDSRGDLKGDSRTEMKSRSDIDLFDITIIGAGPVGLYGMYYAGLRGARAKVIEGLPSVGGGLAALYPEKFVYDIAGFPQVRAKEYVGMAYRQAAYYQGSYALGQKVRELNRRDDGVIELVTKKEVHYSRTVIIACGMGAFVPRRLDLTNVRELEGKGIYYNIGNFERFKDKRLLIVGGDDSAFDYAIALEPIAKEINLIHRSATFAAHEESVEKVKKSSVSLHYPLWEVKAIHGTDWIEAVTAVQTQTGQEKYFEVDACLFNIGFLANLGPIKNWGLDIWRNSIKVDEFMRSNIEGVYAAGDIVTHSGKIKLITTGCGEIAIAVNHAKTFIDPSAKLNPGHSSHLKR